MNASSSASAASSSAVEEKPKRRSRLHVHFEDTGESNNRDDSSDARTPSIRAREMSAMPASRISGEESSLFSSSHGSRASSLVPSMSSFKSSHGSKRTQRAFPLRVAEKVIMLHHHIRLPIAVCQCCCCHSFAHISTLTLGQRCSYSMYKRYEALSMCSNRSSVNLY